MAKSNRKEQISIALPVYNGSNYLEEALVSILSQEFEGFELIVSDNCSSDETPHILSKYAKMDKRIKFNRSEKFLSQTENTNRAVKLCSSEWVKLFCHDDLMKKDCLMLINQAIKEVATSSTGLIGNGEMALFMNGYCYSPGSSETKPQIWQGKEFVKNLLSGSLSTGLPAVTTATVRKEAWEKCGGFDPRFIHFDTFFWARLLMKWDYIFVPQILTVNRIHGAQVTSQVRKGNTIKEHSIFWKEYLDEFEAELNLTWLTKLKTRMKGVAFAGTTIAIEMLKCNFEGALKVWLKTPIFWWLILPAFVTRGLKNEGRKVFFVLKDVPSSIIYPT